MSYCPECATPIHLAEEIGIGRVVVCSDCQLPWEVIGHTPMQLRQVALEAMQMSEAIEGDWGD